MNIKLTNIIFRTCNKKATHIPVSISIISRLNSHNLSTNWVVTAEDVLSVVRFAGSACGHFPVYRCMQVTWSQAYGEITKLNQVNSNFVSVLYNMVWLSCFTISAGSEDCCPEIAAQLVCKQFRVCSTFLYKRSPYALIIASNPTNTC